MSLNTWMTKNEESKLQKDLEKAGEVLKRGGVVIFPTDTVYVIGCRMDNEKSIRRVYKIKERPKNQPTLVVVSSKGQLGNYTSEIPKAAKLLMEKYWPGPLTLILKCKKEKIPTVLRGGSDSLAFRLPKFAPLISLINKVGVPLLAPSANFRGELTPRKFSEIDPRFLKQADFVFKAEGGLGQESTILDCTRDEYTIVRRGVLIL